MSKKKKTKKEIKDLLQFAKSFDPSVVDSQAYKAMQAHVACKCVPIQTITHKLTPIGDIIVKSENLSRLWQELAFQHGEFAKCSKDRDELLSVIVGRFHEFEKEHDLTADVSALKFLCDGLRFGQVLLMRSSADAERLYVDCLPLKRNE